MADFFGNLKTAFGSLGTLTPTPPAAPIANGPSDIAVGGTALPSAGNTAQSTAVTATGNAPINIGAFSTPYTPRQSTAGPTGSPVTSPITTTGTTGSIGATGPTAIGATGPGIDRTALANSGAKFNSDGSYSVNGQNFDASGNPKGNGSQTPQGFTTSGTQIASTLPENNPLVGTNFSAGAAPTITNPASLQQSLAQLSASLNLASIGTQADMVKAINDSAPSVLAFTKQLTGMAKFDFPGSMPTLDTHSQSAAINQVATTAGPDAAASLQRHIDDTKASYTYHSDDSLTGQTYDGWNGAVKEMFDLKSELNKINVQRQALTAAVSGAGDVPVATQQAQLQDFDRMHASTVAALTGQLSATADFLDNADKQVNLELGIASTVSDVSYKQQAAAISAISNAVSTGGLAQMDKTQLQNFSDQYGVPMDQLTAFQDAAQRTKGLQGMNTVTDAMGNVTIMGVSQQVDKQGNPIPVILGRFTGVGQPSLNAILARQVFGGGAGGGTGPAGAGGAEPSNTVPGTNLQYTNSINIGGSQVPYLDLTRFGTAASNVSAALPPGTPVLTADTKSNFDAANSANQSLEQAYNLLKTWGGNPADPASKLVANIKQPLQVLLQSDPQLQALQIFKDQALKTAIAFSGVSGGRFGTNMAAISGALNNFLDPKDTIPVTIQKAVVIKNFIDVALRTSLNMNQ